MVVPPTTQYYGIENDYQFHLESWDAVRNRLFEVGISTGGHSISISGVVRPEQWIKSSPYLG